MTRGPTDDGFNVFDDDGSSGGGQPGAGQGDKGQGSKGTGGHAGPNGGGQGRLDDVPPIGDEAPRKKLVARHPLVERRPIKEHAWVVRKLAMRGELTVLVAPSGAGKTTLAQHLAHAMCAGVSWGGFDIPRPLKVLVLHWEDDEDEMDRKTLAVEQAMGFSPANPENLTTVYCGAGDPDHEDDHAAIEAGGDDDDLIVAHYDVRAEKLTPTTSFADAMALIAKHAADVVIVDPVANSFSGPEGNELLKAMARLWRRVARRCRCAVILIHHTKKYAEGMAGNMDAGRNAGTLVGRVRVGLTLFPMTEAEATLHGIDPARRYRFVRLDDGKQSYAGRDDALWFEIEETFLPIADDPERSVVVGTFKPWSPAELFRGFSTPTIHAILRDIDKGVVGEDGKPTEMLFQPRSNATYWAGDVLIRHVPDCTPERAKRILGAWKHDRLLVETSFEDPRHRRARIGLKSNPAKWPGTTS